MDENAKLKIAMAALQEIKTDQGKVCRNFELCRHTACTSSVASYFIADKALKEIEGDEFYVKTMDDGV